VSGSSPRRRWGASGVRGVACGLLVAAGVGAPGAAAPIEYWDRQRIGANYFNEVPTREWFEAAAAANIRMVRLVGDKWKGGGRDFLLGNADDYRGLVEEDFARLRLFLDVAHSFGVRVVVTPLSLPGSRFRQNNGMKRDPRLWTDPVYLPQAARFWKDLAGRLKGHPAVAAYNLLNEPHPEWFHGMRTFWRGGFSEWYRNVKGTPGDLNRFNRVLVEAIREADRETPIVVEAGLYATPWAFEYLEPLQDDKILYSLHMYEPYEYTTRRVNQGRFRYPGKTLIGDLGRERFFDRRALDEFFDPVRRWAKDHRIPANRIFAGEFGCDRKAEGAARYLADLISIFDREGWHWAFYTFREDGWESMDYELGTGNPGELYWQAVESSSLHKRYREIYGPKSENPVWLVFKRALEKDKR
jgi:hypothetical protein